MTDLSKYKSPKGIATALAEYLKAKAKDLGYDPNAVVLCDPERYANFCGTRRWGVIWEGGPFDWAPCLSAGASIIAGELGDYSLAADDIKLPSGRFYLEPYYGFDLCVAGG